MIDQEDNPYFCNTHRISKPPGMGCSECHYQRQKLQRKAEKLERDRKKKRSYSIPKMSQKKAKEVTEISKLKALRMKSVKCCENCGYAYKGKADIDYSHVLPQGAYPEYATHPLNGLLECRSCHNIWTFGTAEEKRAMPNFPKKQMLARQINPEFAEKMTKDEFWEELKQAS